MLMSLWRIFFFCFVNTWDRHHFYTYIKNFGGAVAQKRKPHSNSEKCTLREKSTFQKYPLHRERFRHGYLKGVVVQKRKPGPIYEKWTFQKKWTFQAWKPRRSSRPKTPARSPGRMPLLMMYMYVYVYVCIHTHT